ncbi:GIY-YIG nuclease family protein [Sphingobacteriales bacterium CHB3]|nr:GIY-YIG nuclease family protein [Sphingobacteriales bacterium CHB3]
MYYVYVLWSEKLRKRYVGSTKDLQKRLREHNRGNSPYTKSGIPWKSILTEEFSDSSSARRREMFLKSGVGRKWLDDQLRLLELK